MLVGSQREIQVVGVVGSVKQVDIDILYLQVKTKLFAITDCRLPKVTV
jgi:hypothetical protein